MVTDLSNCQSARYQIIVQGVLGNTWQHCFDEMQFSVNQNNGQTILEGILRDQSQLMRLLQNLNGLAMPLIKVECLATIPENNC